MSIKQLNYSIKISPIHQIYPPEINITLEKRLKIASIVYDHLMVEAKKNAYEYIEAVKKFLVSVPKHMHKEILQSEYDMVLLEFQYFPIHHIQKDRFYTYIGYDTYNAYLENKLNYNEIFLNKNIFDLMIFFQNEIERIELTLLIDDETDTSKLKSKPSLNENIIASSEQENRYPRIFEDIIHYNLFESYLQLINKKNQLAECSFLYWSMLNDGFIIEECRPTEFRSWLSRTFEIELSELKPLNKCNGGQKQALYNMVKKTFEL